MSKITTRLMGAEIEYMASSDDKHFEYVDEYYRGMREVNSILLPCTNVLDSMMILKDIIAGISGSLGKTLGTYGWVNGYGMAYNGVHLHLSGAIDMASLETNIFRVINKWGLSPRTVTSWHIFNRPTKYNFKNRRKHVPVFKTPRGTVEIRILDVEYFLNDEIIEDIAKAIEAAYDGRIIPGDDTWVKELLDIHIEDYKRCLEFLDNNMAKWWEKRTNGVYRNTIGECTLDYREFEEWQRPEEVREEPVEPEVTVSTAGGRRSGRSRVSRGEPGVIATNGSRTLSDSFYASFDNIDLDREYGDSNE